VAVIIFCVKFSTFLFVSRKFADGYNIYFTKRRGTNVVERGGGVVARGAPPTSGGWSAEANSRKKKKWQ